VPKQPWFKRWFGIAVAFALVVGATVGGVAAFRATHDQRHEAAERPATEGDNGAEEGEGGEEGHGVEASVRDPNAGYAGWFYGQRSAPSKHVPAGALAAAATQTQTLRANGSVAQSDAVWQNLGPSPTNQDSATYSDPVWSNYGGGIGHASGRVTAVVVDPTDPQVVYEGGADGGVWKSVDGGAHWTSIGDVLGTQSIGSMAIAPDAHNTLYVGTGESNTNADSYFGYGIYKSTDGGANWGKVGGENFNRLTVFQILTQTTGQLVFAATDQGLYRSTNGGNSFTRVLAPGDPALFQSFVTAVAWTYQPNELVAAVGYRGGQSTNGLYVSEDNGVTWSYIGSPPGFDAQADLGRIALASTPQTPGLLYAAVQSATKFNFGGVTVFNGVYKSSAGPSGPWTLVQSARQMQRNQTSALTPEHVGPGYQPGIQAWYNLYVSIDPLDSNDVVVGLEEVWNSTDGGAHWQVIGRYWNFCQSNPTNNDWCNSGPTAHTTTHPDQHAAGWGDDNGVAVLYAGGDGGVWSQTGPTWDNDNWTNDNTNQSTTQCYSAAASGDGTIICGLQDNGFVKYTGRNLWPAIAGGDGADGVIDPDNARNIMGSYVVMNIYESNDGGRSYTTISPGDPDPRFISPIIIDPTDKDHIVALGQKVWETHQGFQTTSGDWQSLDDLGLPLQGTAGSVYGSDIYVGWCGPCNPANFTSSTPFTRGIVTNVGGTWHSVAATGLANRYITGIQQDPANDMHIYVTLSGYSRNWIPGGSVGHVFESTDGGATFTDISGNLPDAPVSSEILVNGSLIVGTDTAVFQRSPSGAWQLLGEGMPTVVISDLTTVPGSNTLVAATHGRGVWTLDLS
jgi:hypothetical protein